MNVNIYADDSLEMGEEVEIYKGIERLAELVPISSAETFGVITTDNLETDRIEGDITLIATALDPFGNSELDVRGRAIYGAGIAWVSTYQHPEMIRRTTIHEISHALGFVRQGSEQEDHLSPGHCSDGGCVMHQCLEEVPGIIFAVAGLEKPGPKWRMNDLIEACRAEVPPDEFCEPCVDDFSSFDHSQFVDYRTLQQ